MTMVENTVIAMLATSHQRASGSEWFVGGYDLAVQALSTWSPMDGAEDTEGS